MQNKNTNVSEIKKTHATVSYISRREIYRLALQSQSLEQDFYLSQKNRLEVYLNEVFDEFDVILQKATTPESRYFFRELTDAGVDYQFLKAWYIGFKAKRDCLLQGNILNDKLKTAKESLSRVSTGIFFKSALKGRESDFDSLTAEVKSLQNEIYNCERKGKEDSLNFIKAYDNLLRNMLRHVDVISLKPFARKVAEIVRYFQLKANEESEVFLKKQNELIDLMYSRASELGRLYERDRL
ncbi:hypothetical protein [Iodobacter fluviatilis]|uniref:Uncharacterized protein n=1 Tax=Iodobacter fluviatilis TaxID=537 RepID=A0A377SUQ9_9NEIS|nr:hypothetical protein [Iodobacter fluviatilis]TCU82958.1 hypothetical protein EV682_11318 [Iodobacter fluviatilis]STR45781.1 Uncharacterised protein [Iodobacter fluviatilis]